MVAYKHTQTPAPQGRGARWMSNTPRLLVYTPYAAKRQMDMIGWLRDDFPDNRNEQGGLLIGRYVRDASGNPVQAEVIEVLQARTECRYPGYIEWSALEEIRMQQKFFEMQDTLAKTDPEAAQELHFIGWWHTHPNSLPVFMSGTDMETQRLKYFKPEKYAVVLNPHKGIWKAFAGKDAVEVASVMLLDGAKVDEKSDTKAEAPGQKRMERNRRKQNRHQKRCTGKHKKKSKRRK